MAGGRIVGLLGVRGVIARVVIARVMIAGHRVVMSMVMCMVKFMRMCMTLFKPLRVTLPHRRRRAHHHARQLGRLQRQGQQQQHGDEEAPALAQGGGAHVEKYTQRVQADTMSGGRSASHCAYCCASAGRAIR